MSKKLVTFLLVALALFAVIFVVAFVFFKKAPTFLGSSGPKLTPIVVTSWQTYKTKDFSFSYPANWKLSSSNVANNFLTMKTDVITNLDANTGVKPWGKITIKNGSIKPGGVPWNYKSIVTQTFSPTGFTGPKNIKVGNVDLASYTSKGDILTKGLTIPYDGGPGNYYEISLSYANINSNDDYPGLFDQILKSFVFIK